MLSSRTIVTLLDSPTRPPHATAMAHYTPPKEESIQSRTLAFSLPEILNHIASFLPAYHSSSLLTLRLVSHSFELFTRDVFTQTFFSAKGVMYTARGLRRLQDMATAPRLLGKLRKIELVAPGWWFAILPTEDELERSMVRYIAAKLDVRRGLTAEMKDWNTFARFKRIVKQWAEFLEVHATMKAWLDAGLDVVDMRAALLALRPFAKNVTFKLWPYGMDLFNHFQPPFDSPAFNRISFYAPLDSPWHSRLEGYDSMIFGPTEHCWRSTDFFSERIFYAVVNGALSADVPIGGLLDSEINFGWDDREPEIVPSMLNEMIEQVGTTESPLAAIRTLGFSATWVKSPNFGDQFPVRDSRWNDPRALAADAQIFKRFLSCAPNLTRLDLKLRCTDVRPHRDLPSSTWRAAAFNTAVLSGLNVPCLRELVLSGTFAGVGLLQHFLIRHNMLTELTLTRVYLGDAQWDEVLEVIESMQRLQMLVMVNLLQDVNGGRVFLTFTQALASVGKNVDAAGVDDLGIDSSFCLSGPDLMIAKKHLKDMAVVAMEVSLDHWQGNTVRG